MVRDEKSFLTQGYMKAFNFVCVEYDSNLYTLKLQEFDIDEKEPLRTSKYCPAE